MINIGRTTIFFSALIAQDIIESPNKEDFGIQCKRALNCAFDWSKQASDAWDEEELHFYGDYTKALVSLEPKQATKIISDGSSFSSDYNKLWDNWNNSSEKYGYINEERGDKSEKILQLWRGEGTIKDYICVGGPKRSAINSMLASIAEFNSDKLPKRPFNCLLVSGPGWGKSFLAKSMATHFNMSYMEFSLAQMATTNDLIDCFDSICSHQNRTDKKVLIFMDEVNSQIEGNKALNLLLSPIWDGSFIRAGKYYKLRPGVWIFASTEPVSQLSGKDASSKGSDFVSRLNGPIIELDSREDMHSTAEFGQYLSQWISEVCTKVSSNPSKYVMKIYDEDIYKKAETLMPGKNRTEQVYLGISLLNRMWGPISEVEEGVLALFHGLLPMNGIRSMEFYVSNFRNVERGKVRCENVPSHTQRVELIRHVIPPKRWYKDLCRSDEECLSKRKTPIYIEARPKR